MTLSTLADICKQMLKTLAIMALRKPAQSVVMSDLNKFCLFIKGYEGANPENNNPYDFRYYFGGYLPKYGVVKESPGGFAMFETYALGELYGRTCITEMIQNHPHWTFVDFFNRFAPVNDGNNPTLYATRSAAEFGVEASANLKSTLML